MELEKQALFQIKGIRDGLLLTIGEGPWEKIENQLFMQVDDKVDFFKGARLALDIGNRILHAAEMGSLRDRFSERGIMLWAIISQSPISEQNAQVLGLGTRLSAPRPERNIRSNDPLIDGKDAILVQRTVRSGLKVESHGHIIILGDVNPGGEVKSDGSVVVWGKCKGNIQAGARGNEDAVICALEMNPMQLRIGENLANYPRKKGKPQPEMAKIVNGQIIFEVWNPKDKSGGK